MVRDIQERMCLLFIHSFIRRNRLPSGLFSAPGDQSFLNKRTSYVLYCFVFNVESGDAPHTVLRPVAGTGGNIHMT